MSKTIASAPLRIAFAGTPEFAATSLAALLESGQQEIVAVYTQPDRPAGRGRKLQQSPVKTLATDSNIPVLQPSSFKDEEALEEFKSLKLDLMIVVAYGQILPKAVLETPRLGCINVHASLLPRWRGAAPIQRAIAAGDQESGITIMQMDEGLDTGDMLLTSTCPVTQEDTAGTLHDKLASLGAKNLQETLVLLTNNTITAQPQDQSQATYAEKISKAEARIDWQENASAIHRKIRAFNPVPVAHTQLFEKEMRIWEAELQNKTSTSAEPQTILAVSREGIDVATGEGVIRIKSLQLAGKRRVDAADFVNGNPTFLSS